MIEDVGNFTGREPDVDGHENSAGQRHAVMSLQHGGDVRTNERDALTTFQAGQSQRRGQPVDPAIQFGISVSLLIEFNGDFIGKNQRAPFQKLLGREQPLRSGMVHLVGFGSRRGGESDRSGANRLGFGLKRHREWLLFDELDEGPRGGGEFFATAMDQTHLPKQFRLADRDGQHAFPQDTRIKLRQEQHPEAGLDQSDLGFLFAALAGDARLETGRAAGFNRLLLRLAPFDHERVPFQLLEANAFPGGQRVIGGQNRIKRFIPDLLHLE